MNGDIVSQSCEIAASFGEKPAVPIALAVLAGMLLFLLAPAGFAQDTVKKPFVVVTGSRYPARFGESQALAAALAQYEARRRALSIAGKYFLMKGLIESYGRKKEEIYSLATREIQVKTLAEGWTTSRGVRRYRVRIESHIYPDDFYRAEIRAQQLARQVSDENLREEMEPKIPARIDPAADLAGAYRHFEAGHWREALIYLDRLEVKYPHWGEIAMAQAIAFYALQDPVRMKAALQTACAAEIARACEDLNTLKRVHELDFGP